MAAYTAKFCARDDDGNEVCDTTHVSVTNRAPSLTGFIVAKQLTTNQYALSADSLRFTDADGNLQPVLYWDLDDDGIFETSRRTADTVVLATNGGGLPPIAVYGKDRWGVSSDTVSKIVLMEGIVTDSRNGKTYKWVKIGGQVWMAENLNYEYKKGVSVYGNWCYRDSTKYCAQYGRLYSWAAAMDSVTTGCGYGKACAASSGRVRGVCPDGWHLPSTAEWDTLFIAVGGRGTAGTKLKSTSGWSNNGNGDDIFGFSALPSGNRTGTFDYAGSDAYFWSSTTTNNMIYAYYMHLYHNSANAERSYTEKGYGVAVRCVKD